MPKTRMNTVELTAYVLGGVILGLVVWSVTANLFQAVGIAFGFLVVAAFGLWFRTRGRQR